MTNTDYNKPRTNLNDLLAQVNKSPVLKSINENLFNRFLTKSEFKNFNGIIGKPDPSNNIAVLNEITEFAQKYQLQPVVYNKFGTIDYLMTFQNFINNLKNLEVDIDNFDTWGALLKFNWIPPIDLDKLINSQDYFWDTTKTDLTPQYITIKNQKKWTSARFDNIKKTISSVVPSYNIFSLNLQSWESNTEYSLNQVITNNDNIYKCSFAGISGDTGPIGTGINILDGSTKWNFVSSVIDGGGYKISINGNKVNEFFDNEKLIAVDSNKNYYFYTIKNCVFNNASLRTDITVEEPLLKLTKIFKTIIKISNVSDFNNRISLDGNFSQLFSNGYIISTLGSSTLNNKIWKVDFSEFDNIKNKTFIKFEENITESFDWNRVSLLPLIELAKAEDEITNEELSIDFIENWNDSKLGKLIWYKNYNIVELNNFGATLIKSDIFTDNSKNFINLDVKINDTLVLTLPNSQILEFNILDVSTNSVKLNSSTFFTNTNLQYKIIRKIGFSSLITDVQPTNPKINQFWVDSVNDQLKQWNGSVWIILLLSFSVLYNSLNKRYDVNLVQNNDWSKDNFWINKNDIKNFTGMIKAQLPIIEYYPYIELSDTSFASKEWKYRIDKLSNYIEVDKVPSLFEIFDINLQSIVDPEFLFIDENTIILNERFGNLSNEITNGKRIRLKDFIENDGLYEIDSCEYLQYFENKRFVTKILLKTPIKNINDLLQNSKILPEKTIFDDPYLGFDEAHWLFKGIKNIESCSIKPSKNPMLDINIDNGTFYKVPWVATTFYSIGSVVVNDDFKVYMAIKDGISALSGGPTGTSASILDNTILWNFIGYNYNYILGLVSQDINFLSSSDIINPKIYLDPFLHDLCLYEDYQEGDIRVYIDGIRQYGTFSELRSENDPNYIGAIKFNNYKFNKDNIIRLELGEYALLDIGKRAVNLVTTYGFELYNLVDIRKIEQQKVENNQYPFFCIFDVENQPLNFASKIFSFKEIEDGIINLNLLKRVEFDSQTKNYGFEQGLIGPNEELYLYKDNLQIDNLYQSIWKKGINDEKYIPKKLSSGEWELSDTWFFNLNNTNRKDIKLSELFQHFNSIITDQDIPSIFSLNGKSIYYLDDNVNYAVGGTIHQYNYGLDLLISSLFVNNLNIIDLIKFAHDQYLNSLTFVRESFEENIFDFLKDKSFSTIDDIKVKLSEFIRDKFEDNEKLDQFFGDSTTYNEILNIGVKNWIATTPYFKLYPKYLPYVIVDEDIDLIQLNHHDGHRSNINLNNASKEHLYKQLSKTVLVGEQTVVKSTMPFVLILNDEELIPSVGDFLIRNDLEKSTRKFYRFNQFFAWDEVNLDILLANITYDFEKSLFDNLPNSTMVGELEPVYDVTKNYNNIKYNDFSFEQFINFSKKNNFETSFSSLMFFKSNDPFTWNYSFSAIPRHPVTNMLENNSIAFSFALYKNIYGTPYPHLEPWILQGYLQKPDWWDQFYLDTSKKRVWKEAMWNNIFNGIIPIGNMSPLGVMGTGLANQIDKLFSYVSVNIDNNFTIDGIKPDGLLPPFWDSNNTTNSRVKSLYDPKLEEFIITPQANYSFGQQGPVEWEWLVSAQKLYDDLIISFKLDPIIFNYTTFGIDLMTINGLLVDKNTKKVFSHKNTIFHGDFDDNNLMKFNGLNQWYINYNRYNGFDNLNSGFRSQWIDWDSFLSYNFNSFIDRENFNISSDIFDISNKDFNLISTKVKNIDNKSIDALIATVLNVPSKFIKNRNNSDLWTVEVKNSSISKSFINHYDLENYDFKLVNSNENKFKIYTYNIEDVGVEDVRGYQIISYNQKISKSSITNLKNNNTNYYFRISIDNEDFQSFSIKGKSIQTFSDLITELNILLNNDAVISIENGDLIIKSNKVGIDSNIDIIDDGLFVSATPFLDSELKPITLFNNISESLQTELIFKNFFIINGNKTQIFTKGSKFNVAESTNFNGVYEIIDVNYDVNNQITKIFTNVDTIELDNSTIDGVIEPVNYKTMSDNFKTGSEVFIYSSEVLPLPLNRNNYFIIKLNDYEFKLAENLDAALKNKPITITSAGSGDLYVGRVESTFSVNTNDGTLIFNRYFSDKRYIKPIISPVISGIQNMVDLIKGYEDYTFDLGFVINNTINENLDPDGNVNSWLLETQKFIKKLYDIRSIRISDSQEYKVTADPDANLFVLNNGYSINWKIGTQITLISDNGELPTEFNSKFSDNIVYYVIPGFQKNVFQLALSFSDAKIGKAINFSDAGFGDITVKVHKNVQNLPTIELNPFQNFIWINNSIGILNNIFSGSDIQLNKNQFIYDNNKNDLTVNDLIILRQDKQTRISLTGKLRDINLKTLKPRYIQGMRLIYDGFENLVLLNNRSSDNTLIYDSFLGLNTPRFYVDFNRSENLTFRPNVGGLVLIDNNLVNNFESTTENLRFLYDIYNKNQNKKNKEFLRQSLGYDGPKDYMRDLKINDDSQFIFWQGMIQNKGTNFSVNSFINQDMFQNLIIDEFFAYKLETFGDSKEKNYIELKLQSDDVSNKELRLEFVLPDSTAIDSTFKSIRLTDFNRFFDQPDQLAKFSPIQTFYFSGKVVTVIENVQDKIQVINGKNILELPVISEGVVISFYDPIDLKRKLLQENIDFIYLNSKALVFLNNVTTLNSVKVTILSYDYDSQNPAKIIDKKAGPVVSTIPIFNPALGQYYFNAVGIVDIKSNEDPANYSITVNNENDLNFWNFNEIGKVWLDDTNEGYYPYYDKQIFKDINDRLLNYGKLSDWADIHYYEWTESNVLPSDWGAAVIDESKNENILSKNKKTGLVYKILFKNTGSLNNPVWIKEVDQHYDVVADLASLHPITINFKTDTDNIVKIYKNGKYLQNLNLGTSENASNNLIIFIAVQDPKSYIHVVLPAHIPTQEELDNNLYKLFTPYSKVTVADKNTNIPINKYYFWVTKKINRNEKNISIFEAEQLFKNMTAPYMIITGFRGIDFGYGLIYGNVFDENAFDVPFRFSQTIVRGLAGLVTDENRYALRFTRDFTLRDKLPTDQQLNDLHTEWVLFREKQLFKVDLYLWNKLIESLIGTTLKDKQPTDEIVPSLNRVLFDEIYNTDTKYGLAKGQVFTNKELSIKTINSILNDSNVNFGGINIEVFSQFHNFNTVNDIILTMYDIYDNFPVSTINYIYFSTLNDALSLKKKHSEFIKTSWVAIQIAENKK